MGKSITYERTMVVKRRIVILVVLIMVVSICNWGIVMAVDNTDTTNTISGEISLQDGDVAGAGGIEITVGAIQRYSGGPPMFLEKYETTITILEGEISANYMIEDVVAPPENYTYLVYYIIKESGIDIKEGPTVGVNDSHKLSDEAVYRSVGFYSGSFSGHTVQMPIASGINVQQTNELQSVDMMITKMREISGTIVLPEDKVAPEGGLSIKLSCWYGNDASEDTLIEEAFNQAFIMPEGLNNVSFKMLHLINIILVGISILMI